jgi:hypothetical protein
MTTAIQLPMATTKLCARCNQLRPIHDFHDEFRCNQCYTDLTALEANKKLKEIQHVLCNTTLRVMAADRKGERINAPHISEVVAKGVELLGGVNGLMTMYTDALKASYEEDPGSRKTLDHLRKFVDLIVASTEHRKSAPDVEGLSDDEIIAEYRTLALQAVTSDMGQFREMLRVVRDKAPHLLEDDRGNG